MRSCVQSCRLERSFYSNVTESVSLSCSAASDGYGFVRVKGNNESSKFMANQRKKVGSLDFNIGRLQPVGRRSAGRIIAASPGS